MESAPAKPAVQACCPHCPGPHALQRRILRWFIFGCAVATAGFFHCIMPSKGLGFQIITKDSWSLSDQFVNVDEFHDGGIFYMATRPNAARALIRKGFIKQEEVTWPSGP